MFRNACFTSYEEVLEVQEEEFVYFVIGLEVCPNTKRRHWQGFCQLKKTSRLKALQGYIGDLKCHVEGMRGTPTDAANYCKKGEQSHAEWDKYKEKGENWGKNAVVHEFGELRGPEQGKRNDIAKVKEMVKAGKSQREIIEEVDSYQAWRAGDYIKKYKKLEKYRKVEVYWYWGKTGSGKTRKALEECGEDFWISGKNLKWWEGYDGQEDVIFDDFRKDFCTFHELLRVLDVYPIRVENKGGSVQMVAKRIWITTAFHPEDLYDTREDLEQLMRRITRIECFGGIRTRKNPDADEFVARISFDTSTAAKGGVNPPLHLQVREGNAPPADQVIGL